MSFGGFLGIGEKYHPLPWKVLTYDTGMSGYVVDLDETTLKDAPTFARDETPDWGSREMATRIHDYYRVPFTRATCDPGTSAGGERCLFSF